MTSGWIHVSYSLNSLKGGYIGEHMGEYYSLIIVVIRGDTRSLDCSSFHPYVDLKHTPYQNMVVPITISLSPRPFHVQKTVWEVLEFALKP